MMTRTCRHLEPALNLRSDAVETHQTGNSVVAAAHTLSVKLGGHSGAPVQSTTGSMDFSDSLHQSIVLHFLTALWPLSPGVIPAPGYFKHVAHLCHSECGAVSLDKLELHSELLAKKATAFFKMSRSSSASASFRFRCRISSS